MKKYLDDNGLLYLIQKIKSWLKGKVDVETGKGLSTNDFTNEEKEKLANLENYTLPKASSTQLGGVKVGTGVSVDDDGTINVEELDWANIKNKPTNVSQFTNDAKYQTSDEVTAAIASAIAGVTQFEQIIVETLPTTGEKGKLYLVPNTNASGKNIYDEYLWIESSGSFEFVGTTDIDLSGYLQKTDLEAITNAEIDTIVAS